MGGRLRGRPGRFDNFTEYRMHPEIACVIFFSLNDYRTQMGEAGNSRFRQRVRGYTDLYGNPKPSWHVLKEWAAPVRATRAEKVAGNEVRSTLTVRDDLPCHAIRGYRMTVSTGDGPACPATIPDALPNESKTVTLRGDFEHADVLSIRIERPTGFSVIGQEIRLT